MGSKWDLGSSSEIIVSLGDFIGNVGNVLMVLKVYTGRMVLGKEMKKEKDCWSFLMKDSCAWYTLGFVKQTKRKSLAVPVDMKQIDFVLVGEKYRKYIGNVKVISWEL